MPSSRGSSQPRDGSCISCVSCIGRRILYLLCLGIFFLFSEPGLWILCVIAIQLNSTHDFCVIYWWQLCLPLEFSLFGYLMQSRIPRWTKKNPEGVQFRSIQSLSHIWLFATPWTAARQASLSITNSRSLLELMSIESVMPSNHLILFPPLLLLPSIFPSIRVFSSESVLCIRWPKDWSSGFLNAFPLSDQE